MIVFPLLLFDALELEFAAGFGTGAAALALAAAASAIEGQGGVDNKCYALPGQAEKRARRRDGKEGIKN